LEEQGEPLVSTDEEGDAVALGELLDEPEYVKIEEAVADPDDVAVAELGSFM
jgi:hypothetical protein